MVIYCFIKQTSLIPCLRIHLLLVDFLKGILSLPIQRNHKVVGNKAPPVVVGFTLGLQLLVPSVMTRRTGFWHKEHTNEYFFLWGTPIKFIGPCTKAGLHGLTLPLALEEKGPRVTIFTSHP